MNPSLSHTHGSHRLASYRVGRAGQCPHFRAGRTRWPPLRASTDTENVISDAELNLRSWIKSKGGAIHPHLRLVELAPCGCRGIIATAPIEANRPAVQIPLTCRLTPAVALELLQPALSAAGMPTAMGLGEEMQLALALAHFRAQVKLGRHKGTKSTV